jgi:hypothetical protein
VMAQLLRQVSRSPTIESALHLLDTANGETEALIDCIHSVSAGTTRNKAISTEQT